MMHGYSNGLKTSDWWINTSTLESNLISSKRVIVKGLLHWTGRDMNDWFVPSVKNSWTSCKIPSAIHGIHTSRLHENEWYHCFVNMTNCDNMMRQLSMVRIEAHLWGITGYLKETRIVCMYRLHYLDYYMRQLDITSCKDPEHRVKVHLWRLRIAHRKLGLDSKPWSSFPYKAQHLAHL